MDLVFLSSTFLGTPLWMWLIFHALVFLLLAFDLGLLNRQSNELGIAASLRLSAFYIAIALIFGVFVFVTLGPRATIEYLTGYSIEKALSIDNVFVISVIFSYFHIPRAYQYRALIWGILAVLILRGVMIGVGAALVHQYEWILYFFGAFLLLTGVKMFASGDSHGEMRENIAVRFLRRHLRITEELHGERFFVRQRDAKTGQIVLFATPLFLALAVINIIDLVFAVDSIPAIFAITTDTFIVYTANIMAVLGLRALYFALAAMVARFAYLKYSLALILIFIGIKIFWSGFIAKVDPLISLAVTLLLLAGGIGFSMWQTRRVQQGN